MLHTKLLIPSFGTWVDVEIAAESPLVACAGQRQATSPARIKGNQIVLISTSVSEKRPRSFSRLSRSRRSAPHFRPPPTRSQVARNLPQDRSEHRLGW